MDIRFTDQRLAEIRAALNYTDWLRFDRADVSMLVNEVERLRAELRLQEPVQEKNGVNRQTG